ncbi:MAG TPA: DUF559 domain-containing protein [Bacteroidota bacterium]|nr:DUF559 domain-containing protein [Bacteroidota bacterium]
MSQHDTVYQAAKSRARRLRKNQTPAESLLWKELRNRRFFGKKFLRQHQIVFCVDGRRSFYIVDFFCHECKLVVEVDGSAHEGRTNEDNLRMEILNRLGLTVVRYLNEEVENDLRSVLRELKKAIKI